MPAGLWDALEYAKDQVEAYYQGEPHGTENFRTEPPQSQLKIVAEQ